MTDEQRLYGLNAVRAVFARRPQAIRKLYLAEARIPQLQPLLKWCVANRIGYRVVADEDLRKLAASSHHEGVVADVLREEPQALTTWLRELDDGPQCLLWLDGVGNPHNLGAILRSAAHFGVAAILLPKTSALALSGAAARVAEGGAEAVPFVRMGRDDNAIAQLRGAGFKLAATVVRGGESLFAANLPQRLAYVLGAEGEGMDPALAAACDLRLSIPGSDAVESLNVAAATAVLLAEWSRAKSKSRAFATDQI
jgi:TrmH RNA methyltransferase